MCSQVLTVSYCFRSAVLCLHVSDRWCSFIQCFHLWKHRAITNWDSCTSQHQSTTPLECSLLVTLFNVKSCFRFRSFLYGWMILSYGRFSIWKKKPNAPRWMAALIFLESVLRPFLKILCLECYIVMPSNMFFPLIINYLIQYHLSLMNLFFSYSTWICQVFMWISFTFSSLSFPSY